MPTVTGYTAAKMKEIEDETLVDANVVGDDLVMVRKDGGEITAGNVRGRGYEVVTSITRPGTPFTGQFIYETDTNTSWVWDGAVWRLLGGPIICTSGTRPASPYNGMEIYETNTKRTYIYDGSNWMLTGPNMPHCEVDTTASAGGNTTSATFVNLGATVSLSIVKYRADTKLVAEYTGAVFNDNGLGQYEIGVLIDGVNYVLAQGYSNTGQSSGVVEVTGLAAATYICTLRKRRVNATGNVNDGAAGSLNGLKVTETF